MGWFVPIPEFDKILNIIPPHGGDPRMPGAVSPYPCTLMEMCHRFSYSENRISILDGLIRLRSCLFDEGITGFQWIGGSFTEDIESQEGRAPRDIDVVTFVDASRDEWESLKPVLLSKFGDNRHLKSEFHVDHYMHPLSDGGRVLVDITRYWYGLFGHRRDGLWKGMLVVSLNTESDDQQAMERLGGLP